MLLSFTVQTGAGRTFHRMTNLACQSPSDLVIPRAALLTREKLAISSTVRLTRRAFDACVLVARSVSKDDSG